MESDFTTVFVHFVKESLLPDWMPLAPTEPGTEAGNQADAALVAYARDNALPLITNEGYTMTGVVDAKMRKLAREAGVAVFAPREFYAGKLVEDDEIEAFLQRFRDEAPGYLATRRAEHGAEDKMNEVLEWVFGYYRLILRGEVAGRDTPARVKLF